MRLLLVVGALALAGCSTPQTTTVEPPTGGEWVDCPPESSLPLAVSFRVEIAHDAGGHATGIHRLDERTFLWVYANEASTLREDRVSRVNPVELARDGAGTLHLCTRVDLVTPTEVDTTEGPNVVAIEIVTGEDLPAGDVLVVVNWLAGGCACDPLPRGSSVARFE